MDNNEQKNNSLDEILESIDKAQSDGESPESAVSDTAEVGAEEQASADNPSAVQERNEYEQNGHEQYGHEQYGHGQGLSADEESDNLDAPNDESNEKDEEKPREKPKRKRRRRKKNHGRLIFGLVLTAIIIAAAILLAAYALKFAKEFLGIGKSDLEIVVEIPMDSSTADIADILLGEEIIDNTYLFRFYSRVKGSDGTFVAGPHTLSPNMSYEEMVEELQTGAVDERESVNIVFPEGITLYDAALKLEEKGVCGASDFIRAFNTADYGFDFEELVKVSSLKFYKMEGYLFPDTYTFYVDEDARIVAKKFCRNFEAKITPDLYGRMNDLEMDLEEVLTLASMVQAEASTTYDMKRVASVFLNRLNNPDEYPLLQSDPTRKYVEEIIKPNIEYPSEAMFAAYNTYEGAGLPPGPICNPGLDAINAVLYPADTDYYYFCANVDTGEVYYAKTLAEHEENLVLAGIS
ncbi:MAG: endolytic transglycosylase MltG [Oscillospiraceae bacterium]|nr:endolytic transglycosylase MltG [Oscillospiraceae bacterium]